MKTALVIGSTGLIGSYLLTELLESDQYSHVITFSKRDTGIKHPKLKQHIIDFDQPESYKELVVGDDFFCTIGTTIKQAGSQKAFRKVDYEYPKQFAEIASQNKVKQFLIISSLRADANSSNFYLKTKGEIQDYLRTSDFETIAVLQPSLLLGNRNEFRLAEKIGGLFMKMLPFLFFGNLKKHKPIEGKIVAKALFKIAQQKHKGFKIYESALLQEMGES
ncbi:NAD(P)H-binding protein [Flavobacterium sp. GP15]|uniref:NAD(P)H-binding protein n=1 Tax=Flavobacterium sp. GP15 TaxID=2758567 RepID=UPI00165E40FD|nr:NAD(P)H-binding protein [Flavobacterium sp. GP15]